MPHRLTRPTRSAATSTLRGRRLLALAAVSALAGGLFGATPPAAQAATCADPSHPIATDFIVVDNVSVGTKKTKTMSLDVFTHEGCGVTGATATVKAPRSTKHVTLTKIDTAAGYEHWHSSLAISPKSLRNSDAGVWPVTYAVSGDHPDTWLVRNSVKRASRLSFNAGPEPVQHHKITYSGKLERASWNSYRYLPFAGKPIEVVYAWDADEQSERRAYLVTRADGTFRVTERFPGTGEYSATFFGSSTTTKAESRRDWVQD